MSRYLSLTDAWIAFCKMADSGDEFDIPDEDFHWWEKLILLVQLDQEAAWKDIQTIAGELTTESQKAYLAAGPLEDLLASKGLDAEAFFDENGKEELEDLLPYVWVGRLDTVTAKWVKIRREFSR